MLLLVLIGIVGFVTVIILLLRIRKDRHKDTTVVTSDIERLRSLTHQLDEISKNLSASAATIKRSNGTKGHKYD